MACLQIEQKKADIDKASSAIIMNRLGLHQSGELIGCIFHNQDIILFITTLKYDL